MMLRLYSDEEVLGEGHQAPQFSQLSSDSDAGGDKESLDDEHSSIPQAAPGVTSSSPTANSALEAAGSAPEAARSAPQAAQPAAHAAEPVLHAAEPVAHAAEPAAHAAEPAAEAVELPAASMTMVAGPSSVTGAQGQARPEAAVPSSRVMQTRSTALLARQQATVDDNEPVFIGNTGSV